MNCLDLFSGIGGFSLGLEAAGMHTTAFCEVDSYCQKVLAQHWPDTPIFADVKRLTCNAAFDTIGLCQRIETINITMPQNCMCAACQSKKSQTSLLLPDRQCTRYLLVEELYSVLTGFMESKTIFTEVEQGHLIMPKTHLNTLYEKVSLFAKQYVKAAEIHPFLKTEEAGYTPTIAIITNLWKLCGYVRNAITNGTSTTNQLQERKEVPHDTRADRHSIDVVCGGYP